MEKNSDKLFIPADWKRWIAENVMLGGSPEGLTEILVRNGFSAELARLEVDAAAQHPYVAAAMSLARQLKKRNWVLETERQLLEAGTSSPVERREALSRDEFFRGYYFQNRPVIMTGALQTWRALELWTPDYLRSRVGDRTVEIQAHRNADPRYEIDSDRHKRSIRFAEYVDMVYSGGPTNDYYMTANNSNVNGQALRELWDDIDLLPDYLDARGAADRMFFWMGPPGTVTPLHHDLTNNFMAQVTGRKLTKLISPAHLPLLYNNHHCYSAVDVDNIDYERYPLFRQVKVHEITLAPGELFFLPVGWWHYVRGLDATITITCTNFRANNDVSSYYETYGAI
jgi:ribosomal protein L16 Arg81 hydroxylase